MVSKLGVKGIIPKTEKRRKSDSVKKQKTGGAWDPDDCDWTKDGGPSIELPDLPNLVL